MRHGFLSAFRDISYALIFISFSIFIALALVPRIVYAQVEVNNSLTVTTYPNPSTPGQEVTVLAVSTSLGCNFGLMPRGTVLLRLGTHFEEVELVPDAEGSATGRASFKISDLSEGTHMPSADYNAKGDCMVQMATGSAHIVKKKLTVTVVPRPQVGESLIFDVTFSEDVGGLDGEAFDISNIHDVDALTRHLSGSGSSYVLTLTGMTESGMIVIGLPKGAVFGPGGDMNESSSWVIAHYNAGPAIESLSPNAGSVLGGTEVTITGRRLTGASSVTFGALDAGSFRQVSDTEIVAQAPARLDGSPAHVDVLVTTPKGTSQTGMTFSYQGTQEISFTDPSDIAAFVPNQQVLLEATASSGLLVRFRSETPLVCSVTGSTATVLAAGQCVIAAEQEGDGSYSAATPTSQSFDIAKASQSISFTDPADIAAFTPNQRVTLNATATSGLGVSFSSTTPTVCSVDGDTATVLQGGTCTVTANQAGDTNYDAAAEASQSFGIGLADQEITFNAPTDTVYAVGLEVGLIATSSSGLPVALVSTTPEVCNVLGEAVLIVSAGTCSVTADAPGNQAYNDAQPVTRSFTIARAAQSIVFSDPADIIGFVPNQVVPLNATVTSGLGVTFTSASPAVCSVLGSQATVLAAGTCEVNANQPGGVNYLPAEPVVQTFSIGKGGEEIVFPGNWPKQVFVNSEPFTPGMTGAHSMRPVFFSIASRLKFAQP
ncbi:IPT/TIG domain-containing protein [Xinfangfangia sp. CPCC 101601]|uniref:IPT/TIG domain-containing protein n=1 Tax=Pseudogemmobacter lacusdianii TaxID=3069608 RepID=A0ABU0VTT1_9RHOB|nr:IPT/TIG domain-containing protein [Xinfangfangia sp. CPCC 101601]MDQ2065124.1 IPT/TIG domain-containing protein [Xinfangfangia sp. CPCC 101601]